MLKVKELNDVVDREITITLTVREFNSLVCAYYTNSAEAIRNGANRRNVKVLDADMARFEHDLLDAMHALNSASNRA